MTTPVRFRVQARPDPQALGRLINFVAQLGLVPRRVCADHVDGLMHVMIEQDGLADHHAAMIAEKMRSSVLVEAVQLSRGRRQLAPLSGVAP